MKSFNLKTTDNLDTVAAPGKIGYDPTSKRLLIFSKNVNYEAGYVAMGSLSGSDQAEVVPNSNLLELSFDD